MKKMILICAVALLGNITATAQDVGITDKAWVAMNPQQLNISLGLNDQQQEQVKAIDQKYVEAYAALENAVPKLNDDQMSTKVADLMSRRDAEMEKVLNAEQYAKWDDMRQKGTGQLKTEEKEMLDK